VSTRGERFGPGGRFTRLLERRPRLFSFVIAVVATRIVFSVVDIGESRAAGYSLVITGVLVIEVVVIWQRIASQRGRVHVGRVGAEGSGHERFLQVVERYGAPVVYLAGVIALGAELALAALGASREILLGVTDAMRWVELVFLVVVILVARSWDRRFPEEVSGDPPG
jgi:hypothetical protein